MRKDRNAFFGESSMQQSGFFPNNTPNMNMMYPNNNMMPYSSATQSSSFYSGPANMSMQTNTMSSEIDSRLAKMERQINRLEARVSKLETNPTSLNNIESNDINLNSSMYMI